jgi:GMP synthase PP-ATPase subunit
LSWISARAFDWTAEKIVESLVMPVRKSAPTSALAAVSGGVDSTVAAALVHQAVGDQLVTIFVDTGCCAAASRRTLFPRSTTRWASSRFISMRQNSSLGPARSD